MLDIYDPFSWRWIVQTEGQSRAHVMLKIDSNARQSSYFDDQGNVKAAQLRFWLSALPPV